jgi:hypothetical protein
MSSSDDNHHNHLTALLGALRDAQAGDSAPAHVETALLRAWDVSHAPRPSAARFTAASRFAAVAAGVVLATGLTVLGEHLRSIAALAPPLTAEASPSVILVGEPIHDGEEVRLVRMRMPASTLHALGIRSTTAPSGDLEVDVDVDVVVGEDGVARGLSLNP